MIEFGGWQFPSGEQHLPDWLAKVNDRKDGRLRYQGAKQGMAMRWCKTFRRALDVGAHVGLHSFYLAQKFERVDAFEPVAEHRECFTRNVPNAVALDGRAAQDLRMDGFGDVTLHACALGDHVGSIAIFTTPGSSGDSYIDGAGDIPLKRLDDFAFDDVSYIKLDCEGFELGALRGGEATLLRCRPTVMVEQKPRVLRERGIKGAPAVDYLMSLGMKVREEKSGDYVLTFDD